MERHYLIFIIVKDNTIRRFCRWISLNFRHIRCGYAHFDKFVLKGSLKKKLINILLGTTPWQPNKAFINILQRMWRKKVILSEEKWGEGRGRDVTHSKEVVPLTREKWVYWVSALYIIYKLLLNTRCNFIYLAKPYTLNKIYVIGLFQTNVYQPLAFLVA